MTYSNTSASVENGGPGPRASPHPLGAEPDNLPTRLGEVDLWWVQKPRGPRAPVKTVLLAWGVLMPLTVATLLWIHSRVEAFWPWVASPSLPQQLLKYEMIVAVFLVYMTVRAAPLWWRYCKLAAEDARRIEELITVGKWEAAGRSLHRYCLLRSAVWRRLPVRVGRWDATIRPHLSPSRRLYIYYRHRPPELPEHPTSSFAPEVVPSGQPSWWALPALLPLALVTYTLVKKAVVQTRQWHDLLRLDVLLMVVLLAGYAGVYVIAFLGRVSYFRLGPGVAQLLRFGIRRSTPVILTYPIRRYDVAIDLTGLLAAISFINRDAPGDIASHRLPRRRSVIEACLRAVLSTAPVPPLPEEQLFG